MKKRGFLYVLWLVLLIFCGPVRADEVEISENDSIRIEMKIWGENSKEYASVIGKDKNGETVWSYYAEGHGMTENSGFHSLGIRDDVYYFDDKATMIAFQAETGTILWKNEDAPYALVSYRFDESGRIICSGGYGPDLCVISPDGETELLIKTIDPDYYWPYNVEYLGAGMARVWFAGNYLDLPYKKEGYAIEVNLARLLGEEDSEEQELENVEEEPVQAKSEIDAYKECLSDPAWSGQWSSAYETIFRQFTLVDLNQDGRAELILREYNEMDEGRYGDGGSIFFEYDMDSGEVKQIPVVEFEGLQDNENMLGLYYGPHYYPESNCLSYSSGEGHLEAYYRYVNGRIEAYKTLSVYRENDIIGWSVYDALTDEETIVSEGANDEFGPFEQLTWYNLSGNITEACRDYMDRNETAAKDTDTDVTQNETAGSLSLEDFVGDYASKNASGVTIFIKDNKPGISSYLIYNDGVHLAGGTHNNNTYYPDSYELERNVLTVRGQEWGQYTEKTFILNEDGTLQKNEENESTVYYPWVWETPISIQDKNPGDILLVQNCKEYITMRSTPSVDGTEVVKLPLGAEVVFLSWGKNGFYKVEYNGQSGYALSNYLI